MGVRFSRLFRAFDRTISQLNGFSVRLLLHEVDLDIDTSSPKQAKQ